jgi:NTE family protein
MKEKGLSLVSRAGIWKRKRKSIGLVLGGGGARGLAHIGVIRALEEESIPIDIVVGTSIGALVGALYATGVGADEMEKMVDEFFKGSTFQKSALKSIKDVQIGKRLTITQKIQAFFRGRLYLAKALFKAGVLKTEAFQAMIDYFVPDIKIQDTQVRFRAVVTDLVSGQPVVMSQGSLRKAVMASCAVPGSVPPLEEDRMLLSDGGIVNLVPTTVARDEGADFVVAVSVNNDIYSEEKLCSALDIYARAAEIESFHLEQSSLEEADVVIRPRVDGLHWTDFSLARDLIQEGERVAREKLDMIRKALRFPKGGGIFANLLKNFRMAN